MSAQKTGRQSDFRTRAISNDVPIARLIGFETKEVTDAPADMLRELHSDSLELTRLPRATHEVCEKHNDVATASLIENWIDQTERRTWFLRETISGSLQFIKGPFQKARLGI